MKLDDFKFIDFDRVVKRLEEEKNKFNKQKWISMREKVGLRSQDDTNIFGAAKKRPSFEYIVKIARITKKPVDYYLYGEDIFIDKNNPKYIELPIIKDYLNDNFEFIYTTSTKSCVYNYKWLKIITLDPHKLLCMRVNGDSMAPFIANGDCIKIDINRKNLSDGSLYAFHFKESKQITIRRVAADLNKIELIPENIKYKTHTVKLEDINIIGQIILLKRLYIMVSENF